MEQRAQTRERQQKAYELHLAGATYQQIADRLDYGGPSGAYGAVKAELDRQTIKEDINLPSELARLDAMLVGLWPKARRGDVNAVDRVLKIGERRAELLTQQAREHPSEREETGLDEFTRRLRDRSAAANQMGQPDTPREQH